MERYTPLDEIPFKGEHECLLRSDHGPHDWYYTSEGGGHMIQERWAHTGKNPAKWHCPGKNVPTDRSEYYLG